MNGVVDWQEAETAMNGVADVQSLASTENCSLTDSGHGLSEDSDHSRLALSTFRPSCKQQPRSLTPRNGSARTSDDTGIYIVETAERRAGGAVPWTRAAAHLPYGNNLATGCDGYDKLSSYKPWQPASVMSAGGSEAESSPSTTRLKRTTPAATTVEPRRTGGRGAERSLKKNNEDHIVAATKNGAPSSSLPPMPPANTDGRGYGLTPPSPRSSAVQSQRRAPPAEHNLSPVASSTDANMSDLESSTSGSFLVLGPHGTSRLACVSELWFTAVCIGNTDSGYR